jgi:hypothetical protein
VLPRVLASGATGVLFVVLAAQQAQGLLQFYALAVCR